MIYSKITRSCPNPPFHFKISQPSPSEKKFCYISIPCFNKGGGVSTKHGPPFWPGPVGLLFGSLNGPLSFSFYGNIFALHLRYQNSITQIVDMCSLYRKSLISMSRVSTTGMILYPIVLLASSSA